MDNDKLFTIYVLALTGGLASVITASVMAGIATVPSPLVLVEHLAMSFGIRAAYKWVGGSSWDDWSLMPGRLVEATSGAVALPQPEPTIDREAA